MEPIEEQTNNFDQEPQNVVIQPRSYPSIAQAFGIIGILILCQILFAIPGVFHFGLDPDLTFLIQYSLGMGVGLWVVMLIRKSNGGKSGFRFIKAETQTIFLCAITAISLLVGVVLPLISLIPIPQWIQQIFLEMAQNTGIYAIITVVVLAPILEELVFRGIMLDGFLNRYSPIKAILVSSMLFGLLHLNPWQFITALNIGIFSGWVYFRTRNLTLPLVIHLANNLFATSGFLPLDTPASMNRTILENYGGATSAIILITLALVVSGICIHILNQKFTTADMEANDTITDLPST